MWLTRLLQGQEWFQELQRTRPCVWTDDADFGNLTHADLSFIRAPQAADLKAASMATKAAPASHTASPDVPMADDTEPLQFAQGTHDSAEMWLRQNFRDHLVQFANQAGQLTRNAQHIRSEERLRQVQKLLEVTSQQL